jgi:hypothetical protein
LARHFPIVGASLAGFNSIVASRLTKANCTALRLPGHAVIEPDERSVFADPD